MKKISRLLSVFLAVVCLIPDAGRGDAGTVVFSSEDAGSFPKTVKADRNKIEVNLSVLDKEAAVSRAVLWPHGPINGRMPGKDKPPPVTVTAGDSKEALRLEPPRYRGFVCTEAVAAAVKAGTGKVVFNVVSLPGYERQNAHLEVTCSIKPKTEIACVTNVQAWHKSGQTFITWTEPEPAITGEEQTAAEYKKVVAKLAADKRKIGFRVYRHTEPISGKNISGAEIVDRVAQLTCWNPEFNGKYMLDTDTVKLPRYVVKDGEKPVPPGTGIYVHNPKKAGTAHYAVSMAVDGEENLSGICSAGPVEETVGQGEPVLQMIKKPGEYDHHFYNKDATLYYYTRWEAPPNCNMPSRPIDYIVGILPNTKPPSPLDIRLHAWGGNMHGGGFWTNPDKGTIMFSSNQLPYDWWTGYHECSGTWRSWADGVVYDYSQARLFSFIEWIDTKWKVDRTRVSVGGGSMGGAGTTSIAVHQAGRIAWAAGAVGVHIPDSSPQFTSSYIGSYGDVAWQLPYKDTGASAFNWFSNEWFLQNHPEIELGLVCFSDGKNDGQIGWPQALRFARAMQKMRQPHVFKWGMGGHGEGVKVPAAAAGCRTDRTLPAFTNCSLDDDPGTAQRKPEEDYKREKEEAEKWNKENPKNQKAADRYDGVQSGMFNGHLEWDTDDKNTVDEPDKWSMVVFLATGKHEAPKDECVVDITPRRCQKFKAKKGDTFAWTNLQGRQFADGTEPWSEIQSGTAAADELGLVTLPKVKVTKLKNKIVVQRK